MPEPQPKKDPPVCRQDLIEKSAESGFESDFDWVNDKEALRVTSDARNQGLTANEIRRLAREWIKEGNTIKCVVETRDGYKEIRHHHYDIVINPLAGFRLGLYVYMELNSTDEDEPTANLLNAHPSDSRWY